MTLEPWLWVTKLISPLYLYHKLHDASYVLVLTVVFHIAAVNINFEESSYYVNEKNRLVWPVLIFSNPSSTSITLTILNIDDTATGMYSLVIL